MAQGVDDTMYQCTNKYCFDYQKPRKADKPSPWTGELLDCGNCNIKMKKVK